MSDRLRRRLWMLLKKHDFSWNYQPDPNDRWIDTTSALQEVERELCRQYGEGRLVAFDDTNKRMPVDLEKFAKGAYPAQALDMVECFYGYLDGNNKPTFQQEINSIFEEENSPWRLTDGQFFKVDSKFLQMQVVARAHELLGSKGYEGALEEFKEARNDLVSGDSKGAINNACKSLESAIKVILQKESGNASVLIRELNRIGFYSDIPEEIGQAFGDTVLMSLPFIRNKLGGHGQGGKVVNVPKHYAELAVHLTASFILFITQKSIELSLSKGKKEPKEEGLQQKVETVEEDLPF